MGWTNLFDPADVTLNARISSSGTPSWYGMYVTGFIPVDGIERGSDVFRILNAHGNGTGPTFGAASVGGGQYVAYYDAEKTLRLREGLGGTSATSSTVPVVGAEDGALLHPLTSTSGGANMNGEEVAYVRFCLSTMKTANTWDGGEEISAEDVSEVVITLNEPIAEDGSGGGVVA